MMQEAEVWTIDDMKSANRVIIFTRDNRGERVFDNRIYKEGKTLHREGVIREPAFVRWTGEITENSVTIRVTTTMDSTQ